MSPGSQAQRTDTLLWLKEVVVRNPEQTANPIGLHVQRIDTGFLQADEGNGFTELMQKVAGANVRAYGLGGLATISLRGTGPSHTAVLWNGINIQGVAAGQMDLNLLSNGFADDVAIQYGGSSVTFGSGAIGGTLSVNNSKPSTEGLEFSTVLRGGSFGSLYQSYEAIAGFNKVKLAAKYFRNKADNDFTFRNTALHNAPKEVWEHAGTSGEGILIQQYYDIKTDHKLSLRWWYQDNYQEVPTPFTIITVGDDVQKDRLHRILLNYNYQRNGTDIDFKTAWLFNRLNYEGSVTETNAWINEAEATIWLAERLYLNTGLNYTHETGNSNFYGTDIRRRNRLTTYAHLKRNWSHGIVSNLSVRQEMLDGKLVPFIPSLSVNATLNKKMFLRGSTSRVYRIPTFNDLYWRGSGAEGNPDLAAESGWGEEIGWNYMDGSGNVTWELDLSLYGNQIQNWILWTETDGIWSPENVKTVWSRGMAWSGDLQVFANEWIVGIGGNYQYTLSTNKSLAAAINSRERNKQLPYVPYHQGKINVSVRHKNFRIIYIHAVTGKQFTNGDNSEAFALPRYDVGYIKFITHMDIHYFRGALFVDLNNILGEEYNARRGYPMPGFYFNIGINLNFNNTET